LIRQWDRTCALFVYVYPSVSFFQVMVFPSLSFLISLSLSLSWRDGFAMQLGTLFLQPFFYFTFQTEIATFSFLRRLFLSLSLVYLHLTIFIFLTMVLISIEGRNVAPYSFDSIRIQFMSPSVFGPQTVNFRNVWYRFVLIFFPTPQHRGSRKHLSLLFSFFKSFLITYNSGLTLKIPAFLARSWVLHHSHNKQLYFLKIIKDLTFITDSACPGEDGH